jgi:hypothetical protein
MVVLTVADGLLSTPAASTAITLKYQVTELRLLITYVSIPDRWAKTRGAAHAAAEASGYIATALRGCDSESCRG